MSDPLFSAAKPASGLGAGENTGHLRRAGEADAEAGERGRRSIRAMSGMALCCIFAMLAAGAPLEILHGVLWVGLGLLLVLFPPPFKVGALWVAAGLLLIGGASLAFLPDHWFTVPDWRKALEALGQPTGDRVTAQPLLSLELLSGLAVSVVASWFMLGHRIPERAHLPIVLTVVLGISGYVLLSMLAYEAMPRWTWDTSETFGLYGNRNHTATLLVMGALASLGVIVEAVRGRRGGIAGFATLALVICIWALVGYSISRAGVLLLFLGVVTWFVALGKPYVSTRMVMTVTVFMAVLGCLFWLADTGIKRRLVSQWEEIHAELRQPAVVEPINHPQDNKTSALSDFRQLIYKDTLQLIRHEPAVGIGLGQFPFIFPQYRKESMVDSKCWHPESNWLLLAAEAGWGTAVVTAVAVAALFFTAFRSARRRRRGWPLALGTLLAAVVVPVHGIFDVPAYHTGIAWTALLLVALSLRAPEKSAARSGPGLQWAFKTAGAAVLLGGVWLLTLGMSGRTVALSEAASAANGIQSYYADAIAVTADPKKHTVPAPAGRPPVDSLRLAVELADQALKTSPLDPDLHYLKGVVLIRRDGMESPADRAFAIQRLLLPDWVTVPYWQGFAWMDRDPERTRSLWREALRRAQAAEKQKKGVYWSPEDLFKNASYTIGGKPAILRIVRDLSVEAGILKVP